MPIRFKLRRTLAQSMRRFLRSRRGNIAALTALLIIPLAALMGMATESGSWFLIQRAAQNAADSAAVAAATNNNVANLGTDYSEAYSVAGNYGFTNGTNNTTIIPQRGQPCPSPMAGTNCYKVTISRNVPIYLIRLVGYNGSVALNSGRGQTISAVSIASPPGPPIGYCMVGLGKSGNAITLSGGNGTDLTGCDMASNSGLKCNGINSDHGVQYGDAVGSSNCGTHPRSGQPIVDLTGYNYTTNASKLNSPPYKNTCSSYNYLGDNKFNTKTGNNLTGSVNWSSQSVVPVCGDLKITGSTTITTAPGGTVLVIENGQLNVPSGATLAASGLTIVFSGTTSDTHAKFPTGSGTLNYSAPESGDWKGIALYQDPALPNSNLGQCNGGNASDLDYCSAGSSPSLYITGLIYMPNAQVTVTGAINHQQNGYACFGIIAQQIVISGTNSIFANPTQRCDRAGLSLPGVPGTQTRVSLVQ